MPKHTCPTCRVHPAICVCAQCSPVSGAPAIWVLQHPAERGHSKGTLRVAEACLPNLEVTVGEGGDDFAGIQRQVAGTPCVVLFPGPDSHTVESLQLASTPQGQNETPINWILLDATWRKARRMLLSTPWLAALPRYQFASAPTSRYRIRSGPEGGLSTVEAIEYLISITTPACDTAPLRLGFEALLEAHLSNMPAKVRQRYG